MPNKDLSEKTLIGINEVFADIFNVLGFKEELIKEEDLKDAPVVNAYKENDSLHGLYSDVSKYYNNSQLTIALLNIENQSKIDKDMPLRIIGYEGAKYNYQLISGKQRYPVASLILNFDIKKRWSKPLRLKECFEILEKLDHLVNDYKLNVIDVAFLEEEDIAKFKSDFKAIADYFVQLQNNNTYNPHKNEILLKYPVQTLTALQEITGDKRIMKVYNEDVRKNKEGAYMYSVYDQMVQKGIEQGIEKGIEQGIDKGKIIAYKTIALNMFKMGMDIDKITIAVGQDINTIKKWLAEKDDDIDKF